MVRANQLLTVNTTANQQDRLSAFLNFADGHSICDEEEIGPHAL